MFVFAVLNASPDSLNRHSIVTDGPHARRRARRLLAQGAHGLDVGGQGSTDAARVVDWRTEWARLQPVLEAVADLGVPVSVDTWRPRVAARALDGGGATVLNAADGLHHDAMWEVAAAADRIVLPFLPGPDPRHVRHVRGDPVEAMLRWFEPRLERARDLGLYERILVDPGTGFAPAGWPWPERYRYQREVYERLGELRSLGRPLYIPVPWRRTRQHTELLELVLSQPVEYVRAHRVRHVVATRARLHGPG